ncbi:MAG: hypothetical protein QNK05_21620 [Myxococcota bacterium]|nr:hypothetical protein [Myxococcota bacterium]
MVTYQIDIRNEIPKRIGRDGEVVATLRAKGFFVKDVLGEYGSQSFEMKLPAPWRGMRYRLEQDGRELASAARAQYSRDGLTMDLEIPGRKLQLASKDRRGHEFVLSEAGEEHSHFTHRPSREQGDWLADYHTREESVPLAAFVAWLITETRRHLNV